MSFKPIKIETFDEGFCLSLKNGIKSLEINIENNLKKSRY